MIMFHRISHAEHSRTRGGGRFRTARNHRRRDYLVAKARKLIKEMGRNCTDPKLDLKLAARERSFRPLVHIAPNGVRKNCPSSRVRCCGSRNTSRITKIHLRFNDGPHQDSRFFSRWLSGERKCFGRSLPVSVKFKRFSFVSGGNGLLAQNGADNCSGRPLHASKDAKTSSAGPNTDSRDRVRNRRSSS